MTESHRSIAEASGPQGDVTGWRDTHPNCGNTSSSIATVEGSGREVPQTKLQHPNPAHPYLGNAGYKTRHLPPKRGRGRFGLPTVEWQGPERGPARHA
jgi:hypothetical protein